MNESKKRRDSAELLYAINGIDRKFIAESSQNIKIRKPSYLIPVIVAACMAMMIGLGALALKTAKTPISNIVEGSDTALV